MPFISATRGCSFDSELAFTFKIEEGGFINSMLPLDRAIRDRFYRLTDEFSLFHLKWLERRPPMSWQHVRGTPRWRAWAGLAFESLCQKHIQALLHGLGISGISTVSSAWTHAEAQIDLLIDRADGVITVCEMKFTDGPFTISKSYAEQLRRKILSLQASFNAVDHCRKPVIAAIQGYCLGGAIDLISACDMRYCSADARFSIKEIDMGMAADVGTLQRLPRIIGDGMMRELAYTGRTLDGAEAQAIGLVNRVYENPKALMEGVNELARQIAEKSPLAIRGTKEMIRYMRDHRVDDGLEYIATWNAAMLQAADLRVAVAAHMARQKPDFAD